ncbi:MAG TPA: protein kinase [Thermoanaerobaculia bacterium]|nr:protein kinase [Thermoanaerobaculia bacterium]
MIAAGSRFGPYEIVAPIGAGGMGEVYRAHDPRIGRDVAIKLLPGLRTADPERMRRFEQEARTAGMLSHPNLLTIFELGSEEGVPYIVSELLEGTTLRALLSEPVPKGGSPIPLRKAIDFAIQIANGLGAAHEKGIIHRDLKPENIFVTGDDRVKLLDFGLAKVLRPEEASDLGDAPTRHRDTEPGMVLGTVGYMAPEQVRGEPTDHRSDLFSFGVVLYEIFGGQRAFHRGSNVETMNAILHDDPRPLLDGNVPPAIERVILRLVDKNPAQRFQSARDVAFAIEMLSGSSDKAAGTTRRKPKARTERAAAQPRYQRLTFRRGFVMSARFASDGAILYGAAWEDKPLELFSCRRASPESQSLRLPEADVLSISSGGEIAISLGRRYRAGWATSGTLARVSVAGTAPREIAEHIQDADWTPDGKGLAIIRSERDVFAVEYPIGTRIFQSAKWLSHVRVSPKGDRLAMLEHPVWGDDRAALVVVDLQGNRLLTTDSWKSTGGIAWSPKGDEVWVAGESERTGRDLHAVSASGKKRIALGSPGRLTLHDIAADGRVLLSYENGRREIMAGRIGEPLERNLSWFDWSFPSDVSADGTSILFEEQGHSVATELLCLRRTDGSPAISLIEGRGRALSADAKWVVALTGSPPHLELVPTGTGQPRPIRCEGLESWLWWYWRPDGKALFILATLAGCGQQLFELELEGDGIPRAVTPEGVGWPAAISPNGKHVAVASPEREITIYAVDGGESRPVQGCSPGDKPLAWSPDRRYLYICGVGRTAVAIDRVEIETGERTLWHEIRPADPAGVMDIFPVFITPDGQTYVYGYRRFLSDLYVVEGLF